MPTAFVLIDTAAGSESDVLRDLKNVEGLEASLVYGICDIILRVESSSMEDLKRTITWKIRKLDKITRTETMITQI